MAQIRVLIVGAHHEEIEAECPNIAALLAQSGCRVVILNPVGSWNWTYVRAKGEGERERIISDATLAASALGCEKVIWDYPMAQLAQYQAELSNRMAAFVLDYKPELVLMHWGGDSHADHRFVAKITRQILTSAPELVPELHPDYQAPKEVYAFQTGVNQAYNFIPDLLVKTTDESMRCADRAIECFSNSSPEWVETWRNNFHSKAAYWGNLLTPCGFAEALKFLGPELPLDGFLLKRILGAQLVPAPLAAFFNDQNLQL